MWIWWERTPFFKIFKHCNVTGNVRIYMLKFWEFFLSNLMDIIKKIQRPFPIPLNPSPTLHPPPPPQPYWPTKQPVKNFDLSVPMFIIIGLMLRYFPLPQPGHKLFFIRMFQELWNIKTLNQFIQIIYNLTPSVNCKLIGNYLSCLLKVSGGANLPLESTLLALLELWHIIINTCDIIT